MVGANENAHLPLALPVDEKTVLVGFEQAIQLDLSVILLLRPAIEDAADTERFRHLDLPVELEPLRHLCVVPPTSGEVSPDTASSDSVGDRGISLKPSPLDASPTPITVKRIASALRPWLRSPTFITAHSSYPSVNRPDELGLRGTPVRDTIRKFAAHVNSEEFAFCRYPTAPTVYSMDSSYISRRGANFYQR